MSFSVATTTYKVKKLEPAHGPNLARQIDVNIGPSLTIAAGTVLGQVTASAADVQSVVATSASAGTFTLSGVNPISGATFTTATIAFGASAATTATAVQNAIAATSAGATVVGTGGALPNTAVVLTFGGTLANMPVPLMTGNSAALTGGTAVITHTTTGATAGTFAAYSGTVLAPLAAPTVAGNGTGSSFGAGSYAVSVTQVTAYGESTPSPATVATVTAAQNLRVSAIASLNAAVTKVRYYVDDVLMAETVPSAGTAAQTDITGAALAVSGDAPTTNTAYTAPNGGGTQLARALAVYDMATDASGNITYGTANTGNEWGQVMLSAPVYVSGIFQAADLVGLDANAVAQLGSLQTGTTTLGLLMLA